MKKQIEELKQTLAKRLQAQQVSAVQARELPSPEVADVATTEVSLAEKVLVLEQQVVSLETNFELLARDNIQILTALAILADWLETQLGPLPE